MMAIQFNIGMGLKGVNNSFEIRCKEAKQISIANIASGYQQQLIWLFFDQVRIAEISVFCHDYTLFIDRNLVDGRIRCAVF